MSAETDPDGAARVLRVLRSFGPVRMDNFDDRLRQQKLAYLIQEIGGGGPFVYHWDIRGPYSPALTQELFASEGGGGEAPEVALLDGEAGVAQRVRSLVGDAGVDDPLEAELYASVWYLTPSRKLSDSDKTSIMETMRRTKPHFAGERVGQVLGDIESFRAENGMVPQGSAG